MDHFVDDDVLDAGDRLLGEFGVEPDALVIVVARPPFSFHPLDAPEGWSHSDCGTPGAEHRSDKLSQFESVPAIEHRAPLARVGIFEYMQFHLGLCRQSDFLRSTGVDNVHAVTAAEQVMALARDGLSLGLAGLSFELLALATDPGQLADHSQSDRVV